MEYIPLALLVFILGTLIGIIYRMSSYVKKADFSKVCDELSLVHRDAEFIKAQITLYDAIIKPHLARLIHSPTHKRRDELVDLFSMGQISVDEAKELDGHLQKLLEEETDAIKRFAAAMLLSRARWAWKAEEIKKHGSEPIC